MLGNGGIVGQRVSTTVLVRRYCVPVAPVLQLGLGLALSQKLGSELGLSEGEDLVVLWF